MTPVIEVVTNRVTLGEGPHWDIPSQSLYYVDILGQALHKYVPATNTHTKARIGIYAITFITSISLKFNFFNPLEGGPVGFAVPVQGRKNSFVIGLGRKIALVKWNGVSEEVSEIKILVEVDNEIGHLNNRFNDGKADPTGRLWAGEHFF